jgi:protein-S-isoprenylcysteine O-methyltransferase Ste14
MQVSKSCAKVIGGTINIPGGFMRIATLLYGTISYLIGFLGLVCIIAALAKLLPFGFLHDSQVSLNLAVLYNFVLVIVWGLIHSYLARPSVKEKITKIIPEPIERSTYVLIAGLTSFALIGYWSEVPGILWSISGAISYLIWGLFVLGWVFLFAATFAINHFDLFGLRQVYFHFKNMDRPPLAFVEKAMYRYIRHPIQTGVLVGIWATPEMSCTHLILSIGFSVYIFIGLIYEERDLIAEHGDSYRAYRDRTGKILPKF